MQGIDWQAGFAVPRQPQEHSEESRRSGANPRPRSGKSRGTETENMAIHRVRDENGVHYYNDEEYKRHNRMGCLHKKSVLSLYCSMQDCIRVI